MFDRADACEASREHRADACEATQGNRAEVVRRRAQRGSAVILMPLVLAGAIVMSVVIVHTARIVQARSRAQHAADAAALAALVEGAEGGTRLATANGATVVRIEVDDDHAFVEVVRDGVHAEARAERSPGG